MEHYNQELISLLTNNDRDITIDLSKVIAIARHETSNNICIIYLSSGKEIEVKANFLELHDVWVGTRRINITVRDSALGFI